MEAKQYTLSNQQITEEIKEEIKKYLETNSNENTTQNPWDAVKAVLREVYSNTSLCQETRETTNKHLTFHLKQLEKEREKSPKVNARKEIRKIRAELNGKKKK